MQVSVSYILKSIGRFHSISLLVFFFTDLFLKVFFSLFNFSYHKWNTVFSTFIPQCIYSLLWISKKLFYLFFVRFFLHFLFFLPGLRVLCILGIVYWGSFLLYILQIAFWVYYWSIVFYIWCLYRYKNINWTLTWCSICCSKYFVHNQLENWKNCHTNGFGNCATTCSHDSSACVCT